MHRRYVDLSGWGVFLELRVQILLQKLLWFSISLCSYAQSNENLSNTCPKGVAAGRWSAYVSGFDLAYRLS